MRLIDADALKEAMASYYDYSESLAKDVCQQIDATPTIDAVPVVRCKDCKWWDDEKETCGICSVGEREDNE